MKQKLFLIITALLFQRSFAQITFSSVLLDSTTREPVAFANIGIPGKGIGTVSDEYGKFSLIIPDSLKDQIVRITMIGYQKTGFYPSENQHRSILLKPQQLALKEVDITAKKIKVKILGNDTKTKRVQGGFSKNYLGAELATLMNIKHKGTQLTRFFINISANSLSVNPVFRINIYKPDQDRKPGVNILQQNIIVEAKEKTGLLEVDLKPYMIFTDEDVFVSIEWIKDLGDAKGLFFSTKLIGAPTYYKNASQDKWEKIPSIGIGLHVEAMY